MEEKDAAEFAAAEGIVGHLTSLVLVDEASESVGEVPATRKVALASPVEYTIHDLSSPVACSVDSVQFQWAASASYFRDEKDALLPIVDALQKPLETNHFRLITGRVNWDVDTAAVASGRADGLDEIVQAFLRRVSKMEEIVAVANELGVSPMRVAIALLAKLDGGSSPTAARIARSILRPADRALLDAAMDAIRRAFPPIINSGTEGPA
jgi:hypothetical protein